MAYVDPLSFIYAVGVKVSQELKTVVRGYEEWIETDKIWTLNGIVIFELALGHSAEALVKIES